MKPSSLQKSTTALFAAAQKLGLSPTLVTNYGLMTVIFKGIEQYLFVSKTIVNTQLAAYLTANKHATRTVLATHNLPNIPFLTPQSLSELAAFFEQHGQIVAKPTLGQRAEGVRMIRHQTELHQYSTAELKNHIFEKYLAGRELRYLVLDDQVIAVQEKVYPGEIYQPGSSTRTSFARSAWDPQLLRDAVKICQVLGLGFGAVDFKVTDQQYLVLEVNSAPALWRFEEPDQGPSVPVCQLLLEATMKRWTMDHLAF